MVYQLKNGYYFALYRKSLPTLDLQESYRKVYLYCFKYIFYVINRRYCLLDFGKKHSIHWSTAGLDLSRPVRQKGVKLLAYFNGCPPPAFMPLGAIRDTNLDWDIASLDELELYPGHLSALIWLKFPIGIDGNNGNIRDSLLDAYFSVICIFILRYIRKIVTTSNSWFHEWYEIKGCESMSFFKEKSRG